MKKAFLNGLILSSILISGSLYSNKSLCQNKTNDPVLLTLNNNQITSSEFLRIYKKNNSKNEALDKKSLEDYLNLYINFRLKVEEAKELKIDTAKAFIKELSGYREQLAQPYLTDTNLTNKLLKEAYNRMQFDIRASHILIKLPTYASPKDTAEAYNKLMGIRKRILNGESFEKMAVEYSDDPYVKDQEATQAHPYPIKGNKGDLGYFTAFDMIYPFENAAYNTEVGKISMPVRTPYGFHLIKVTDKKSALGKITAAHIYVMVPPNANDSAQTAAKKKIDNLYQMILDGAKYDSVAKAFSDDKSSAVKGGVLRTFTVSRMVPEFIETIYTLKKGEISKPIQTQYGWHIVKLVDKKGIGTFDELKSELKEKMNKDNRGTMNKAAIISKAKKDFGFKENKKELPAFYTVIDTTIFSGKWDKSKAEKLHQPMFTLGKKDFTQQDFASYISTNQKRVPSDPASSKKMDKNELTNEMYKNFVDASCYDYLNNQLENLYPEFKALMQEYRDGMLLFELTDKKVWSKSVKDSSGLANFYQQNKNKYMWGDRINASIFTCADKKTADAVKKQINKSKSGYTDKALLDKFNKDNAKNLKIDSAIYSKGDNKIIDAINWQARIADVASNDSTFKFVVVNKLVPAQPKSLDEAKGLITSDYQDYLEKSWISDLKKKYPVVVNNDALNALIK